LGGTRILAIVVSAMLSSFIDEIRHRVNGGEPSLCHFPFAAPRCLPQAPVTLPRLRLAAWIELYREDEAIYRQLVNRAVAYLPMLTRTSKAKVSASAFAAIADPTMASRLEQAVDPERLARVRAEVADHPSRVFANALANVAWRNGPVEDIHAGRFQEYPLTQRRVTPAEEKEPMQSASDGLALGLTVCCVLLWERPPRPRPEQALPCGLATMMLITPHRWTLTETSREVRLPLSPP
jgi:hypothetical protein